LKKNSFILKLKDNTKKTIEKPKFGSSRLYIKTRKKMTNKAKNSFFRGLTNLKKGFFDHFIA